MLQHIPPFSELYNRLTAVESALSVLTEENSALKAEVTRLAATERKDSQLERIATATEYLKKVESHRQESAGQRSAF